MTNAAKTVQGTESAFPQGEYDERIQRARAAMAARGLDALVVTGPENIFYLCGQQTRNPSFFSGSSNFTTFNATRSWRMPSSTPTMRSPQKS